MKTYRETYPNSLSDGSGLITAISNTVLCPWNSNQPDDPFYLSLERAYNVRSGFKTLIPSFEILPENVRASMILDFYLQKWEKLFSDYTREYNPLDGYTLTETGHRERDIDTSHTTDYGRTNGRTETDTGTVGNVGSDNMNTSNSVYGFNSTTGVPSNTGNETTTSSGTETRDLIRTTNDEAGGQDTRTGTDKEVEEYSYTKTGNIGYTSPPDLMRRDLELWSEFSSFFEIVFSDIDRMITISVY